LNSLNILQKKEERNIAWKKRKIINKLINCLVATPLFIRIKLLRAYEQYTLL